MSKEGIKIAADAFSHMQQARQKLLRMGTRDKVCATKSGHQDILLGQMMKAGEDAMKVRFMEIIDENT